jgi:hypothetical protein
MTLTPDKAEMEAIRDACQRATKKHPPVVATAIETDVIEAFQNGKFTIDEIETWLAKQFEFGKTHLFERSEQRDREAEAFTGGKDGRGSVTSRGALVKEIGIAAADAAAKRWGLASIHDYRTKAERPNGDAGDDKAKKHSERGDPDNPWSWPAGEKRDAEILRMVKAVPTKLVRSLAAKANCRIDGRSL